jgi:8-oxo-dGTP diphosphatase
MTPDHVTIIELLRHGRAGRRGQWTGGPDHQRPLDEGGQRQARMLVPTFDDGPLVTAIMSSSFTRCVQTVEPLAEALGLTVEPHTALEEISEVPVTDGGTAWVNAAWMGGRALRLIDRLGSSATGARIVLCSHGDVIPALLATLTGRDGLPMTDVRCQKAGRHQLRFAGGRCVEAVAIPPPSSDSGPTSHES